MVYKPTNITGGPHPTSELPQKKAPFLQPRAGAVAKPGGTKRVSMKISDAPAAKATDLLVTGLEGSPRRS